MHKIREALSLDLISVGQILYQVEGFERGEYQEYWDIVGITPDEVSLEIRKDGTVRTKSITANGKGSINDQLKDYSRSINPRTAKIGDRGYLVQQHTGITFKFAVIRTDGDESIDLKYDNMFRMPETKNNRGCSLAQKMMYCIPGEPNIEALTYFGGTETDTVADQVAKLDELIESDGTVDFSAERLSENVTWGESWDTFKESMVIFSAYAREGRAATSHYVGNYIIQYEVIASNGKAKIRHLVIHSQPNMAPMDELNEKISALIAAS